MQAYEMNNKATEGLAKKLAVYREANPLQEPSVTKTHMIKFKGKEVKGL